MLIVPIKIVFCPDLYVNKLNKLNIFNKHRAHRESAVFHLHGVIFSVPTRISTLLSFKRFINRRLSRLKNRWRTKGKISPEVAVLQQLAKDGFIAEIKTCVSILCQYAPEPTAPEPENEITSNLIIKVTQSPQAWLPMRKFYVEWHRELTHLIDGFRNEMVEF